MRNISRMVVWAIVTIAMLACERDISTSKGSIESDLPIEEVRPSNIHDELKVEISKWLAYAVEKDIEFKQFLFQEIVDIETGLSEELFFLELINMRYKNGKVLDLLIEVSGQSEETMNGLLQSIEHDFYNAVVDVPDFISWYFYPQNQHTGVKENYSEFPFVFYPTTDHRNSQDKWVGYGQFDPQDKNFSEDLGLVLHAKGPREGYSEQIPIFVKQAEFHYLIPQNSRDDYDAIIIKEFFGDINSTGTQCIKDGIDAISQPYTLGATVFDVVDVIDLKGQVADCDRALPPLPDGPPQNEDEICNNGIDDDGDGLIDEEDCISIHTLAYEMYCDDGIDNDGDGLIDADDPDCICNCLRDCNEDENYLYNHPFDDVLSYYYVTSENILGAEKMLNIRYDILRLNAPACPPGPGSCPFTQSTRYVYDRATMLACGNHIYGMDSDDIATLCIGDEDAWSAYPTGFYYGWVSDNSIDCNSNDCIVFGVLNGYFAKIVGTNNYIKEKVYYLPGGGDNNVADWDASIYGDMIRISLSELDTDQLSSTVGNIVSTTKTTTWTASVGGGIFFGIGNANASVGYNFSNSETKNVSASIKIDAKNLVDLGDIDLIYCDDQVGTNNPTNVFPNNFSYNLIDDQSAYMYWWEVIDQD